MCKIIRTLLSTQTLPCNGKDKIPNKGITGTSKLRGRDPSVPSCKSMLYKGEHCAKDQKNCPYHRRRDCMKSSN